MELLLVIRRVVLQRGSRHPHLFTPLESPAIDGRDDIRPLPLRKGGVKAPPFLTGFTGEHLRQIKKAAGRRVDVVVTDDPNTAARLAVDADIIAGFPATIPPLGNARNLKWVHSFSAGVDRILTPEIARLPILISNSSGIHATPIAEHLIGFMLLFSRGFYRTFRNQEKHIWQKDETLTELRGRTLLIVGLGDIGLETARLVQVFGMRVLAVSRTKKQKPPFVDELKTARYLDTFLPRADFVAICLPYTKDTHHLFDMQTFRLMKRSAVIMNIGRGGIVHERELIQALKRKTIAGAALDVTETEPLPKSSPLWRMPNVIITPHHSGLSEKYMDRAVELFCENLQAYLRGKPLPTRVNPKWGY